MEDFDSYADNSKLPVGWWQEGSKAVRIEKGRLHADANLDNNGEDQGTSTIWLDKTFRGDICVEFDAHVLASNGDKNNINFFFLFSDPSDRPLWQTKNKRADGQYSKYHKLNGYVFTFLANGNPSNARFRMRDDPGFHLLQENFSYECKQNKTYHITVRKKRATESHTQLTAPFIWMKSTTPPILSINPASSALERGIPICGGTTSKSQNYPADNQQTKKGYK